MTEMILSGEDCRLMGVRGMGASFLRRQIRRVGKVARPVTHVALQTASQLPGGKYAVTALRSTGEKVRTEAREVVKKEIAKEAVPKINTGLAWTVGIVSVVGLGVLAAVAMKGGGHSA